MNPALSVVFFTTLAGTGQGLLLAVVLAQWSARLGWIAAPPSSDLVVLAALCASVLAIGGLAASFFHLGRPERAWRAASQWRTSWLSREVIVLPAFIALTLAYGLAVWCEQSAWADGLGVLAACMALVLFLCTGMIYACLPFLREWATPLTPLNFLLMGCANGLLLACVVCAWQPNEGQFFFLAAAWVSTAAAWIGRFAAWQRNASLAPKSTVQTAIGIKHPVIEQRAQGFMGGSFNTREFFHGRSDATLRVLRQIAIGGAFALPLALLTAGLMGAFNPNASSWLALTCAVQYIGLLAERWLFFAEARHPQNLYYQRMA